MKHLKIKGKYTDIVQVSFPLLSTTALTVLIKEHSNWNATHVETV